MSKKVTQKTEVLKHLRNHNGITSMEAFQLYGVTRLSAKIYELRHDGYVIDNIDEHTKNRYGHPCTYVRYVLVSEPMNIE